MSNYCIMRIQKIKSLAHLQAAYNHNYRLKEVSNADPSLDKFNHELVPLKASNYVEAFEKHIQTIGYGPEGKKLRKNAILAIELVLTMSNEAAKHVDIPKWESQNAEWILNTFPTPAKDGNNILSIVSHESESTPHLHCVLLCVDPANNINASYYIDGPAKLSALQDLYAEYMKPLGLIRGIPESSAHHVDIRRFYSELNRALDVTIPEWSEGETPESYQEKVREDIKGRAAVFFRKEKEFEQELRKEQDIHANEKKVLERQLINAKRKIYKLEKEKEDFEREVGTAPVVRKTVEIVRLMRRALEDMDVEEANAFTDHLNSMIVGQRHKERQQKEREERRVKSIFEKIQ